MASYRRAALLFIVLALLVACSSPQMIFKPCQPTLTRASFLEAREECAAANKSGGWWAVGPLPIVAVVAAVGEGSKERAKVGFANCMEAKGWWCSANCPAGYQPQSTYSEAMVMQPSLAPQLDIAALAERVKAEKTKQWIKYGNTKIGSFYYDPESVGRKDNNPWVREQVAFFPASPGLGYAWRSTEIDCNNSAVRFTDLVAVDKAGNPTDPRSKEGEWTALPEKSVVRILIDRLCAKPERP